MPGEWAITQERLSPVALPRGLPREILDLEHAQSDSAMGIAVDLNQDGTADLLIRAGSNVCTTTGTCTFAIADGRTSRLVGTLTGNRFFIRARRLNGWPVIHTWSRKSARSGVLSVYAFDGAAYAPVAQIPIEGDGVTSLFRDLDKMPAGPP
jgi:hypothetical protein